MNFKHLIFTALCCALFACSGNKTQTTGTGTDSTATEVPSEGGQKSSSMKMAAEAFSQKIALKGADAQIIDVRTIAERNEGFIKNSQNFDISDPAFEANLAKLDKSKPVFVYCAGGGRSAKAAGMMTEMGFTEVYDLETGFAGWREAKLDVQIAP